MLDRGRVREVFAEAAERPAGEVALFLDFACDGDAALRCEVESLLAAARRRPEFLGCATAGALPGVATGEAAGTTIGHYRLEKEIGKGGFGSVYVAEQSEPVRRRVALKIVKLGMDTREVIARFEAERQALATMDHPNIAKVFDAGATDSGRPYFVMELVTGDLITSYCDQANLDISARLGLFVQVCQAVQHAHSKGVIHRDIKPGNVLVATESGRAHAKVIDFGIAKATQGDGAQRWISLDARHFLGTPEYMSPEQADGSGNVDTRADVYGLGVLLYELLTGTTPFDSGELRSAAYGEVQRIIREVEPVKPSTRVSTLGEAMASVALRRRTEPARLGPLLRGDLDWIVMRCLEKDRTRRYPTSDALAADVEAFLRGEVVSAVPPSAGYRVSKFVRRHRVAVGAGVAIAAALVLGTIGTGVGMMRAQQEQQRAEKERGKADQEAAQARAITEFMRQVLTSVEPGKRGAEVRLREVLAEASASAAEQFEGHPLLEAEVRVLLSSVYDHLSLWDKCEEECRRAQALYAEHAGPDDPRTLRAEKQALAAALNSGKVEEVERSLKVLLPRLRTLLGEDDPATLHGRQIQANVLAARGRLDEAEAELRALRGHPRLATDDPMQVRLLIGLVRLAMKRPVIEERAGRLELWGGVVPMAREAVDRSLRHFGPASEIALNAKVHLAIALDGHEDFAAAAEIGRAVLADANSRLDECHHVRVAAMRALAKALGRLGEVEEPTELYVRCVACQRQNSRVDAIAMLGGMSEVMHFLDRAGRAKEGEAMARDAAARLEGFGGHASPFQAKLFVASFVSMDGRHEEAEGLFQPLLAEAEASGEAHARACANLAYGRHLTRTRRFEEAERCLERCAALSGGAGNGTYDGLPDNIVFAFIELYKAWNKPDRVREYQTMRESVFGIPPAALP